MLFKKTGDDVITRNSDDINNIHIPRNAHLKNKVDLTYVIVADLLKLLCIFFM